MLTSSHFTEFIEKLIAMVCREVIIDISSTVVDESKEIVLIEFASLSSNTTLRMTFLECQYIPVELEIIKNIVCSAGIGGRLSGPRLMCRGQVFAA